MNIYLILLSLLLCSCTGIRPRYHEVAAGETVATIARHYEVPVAAVQEHNESVLAQGLHAGDKLYIPFEDSPTWNREFEREDRTVAGNESFPAGGQVTSVEFSWPCAGTVSSLFGPRTRKHVEAMHEGIDIAARTGTPVKAARSGHVIYASNKVRGYGNMVIVRHADSFSTVYAHLSKFAVKKGQFIGRGQLIGKVGHTGRARGSHLHFEIRDKQTPVDPLQFLPGQYATNSLGR